MAVKRRVKSGAGEGTWEKENGTRSRAEERGGRERCSPSPLHCLCLECPLQPSLGAEKPRAPSLPPLPPVREPQPELWMKLLGLQLLCATVRARNGNRVTVTQQPPRSTPPHTGSLLKGPAGNTAEMEGSGAGRGQPGGRQSKEEREHWKE